MYNKTHVSGIYQLLNKENGKRYVGGSSNLDHRKVSHFSDLKLNKHVSPLLQDEYNEMGKDVFKFLILEFVSPDRLDEREQYWIDLLHPEYNQSRYAKRPDERIVFSEVAKERRKQTVTELWKDPIYKAKHCKPRNWKNGIPNRRGAKLTEEQKQHLSEINMGENNPNYGKKRSEETKQKMSDAIGAVRTYAGLVSPNGTIYAPITYLQRFCNEHGLKISSTLAVLKGRKKSIHGWTLYKG